LKGAAVLQNLLPLLPRRIGSAGAAIAFGLAAVGCGLWLAGARFSRPLLAIAATAGGGAIGFQSPHWFGWTIDPWAVAVLGALLLGVCGFLAHRWLAAAGLGVVLAAWGVLAAVTPSGLGGHLFAALIPREIIWAQLADFPNSIPNGIIELMLVAGGVGLVGGTTVALLWPRVGVTLFWTLLGLTLTLVSAVVATQAVHPAYLRLIPRPRGEALALFSLLGLGMAVQWRMAFHKRPASRAGKSHNPA
jgi:hypothetical protein